LPRQQRDTTNRVPDSWAGGGAPPWPGRPSAVPPRPSRPVTSGVAASELDDADGCGERRQERPLRWCASCGQDGGGAAAGRDGGRRAPEPRAI
jgi:hypothetical protein